MVFIESHIPPCLADLVHCITYIQQDFPTNGGMFYFHPPTPQSGICFHFHAPISLYDPNTNLFFKQPQSIIVGPQLNPVWIYSKDQYRTVRVGLLPGALFRLTGIPQNQLLDQGIDAELIFGNKIKTLNQSLLQTISPYTALELIQTFLLQQLTICKDKHHLDAAMHMLWSTPEHMKINKLADKSCLSTRQMERISQQRIGMHPKLYHRIVRFSKAFQMLEQDSSKNLTKLAYSNEYFDRQHLKRDFKSFTGMNMENLIHEINNAQISIQGRLNYSSD